MTVYQEDKVSSDILRRSEIFLLALALVILLFQVGVSAFWGSESRWGEVVREMFYSGNYAARTINGNLYLDKPLFSYYLFLPFCRIFGLTEFAFRLPVALAGWSLIWASLLLGRYFFDRRTALFGGWILLSSYGFIFWSRRVADVVPEAALLVWACVIFFSQEARPALWKNVLFDFFIGLLLFNNRLSGVLFAAALLIPYMIVSGSWRNIFNSKGKIWALIGNMLFFFSFYAVTAYFSGEVVFSSASELFWRLPWGFIREFGKTQLCVFPGGEFFYHNWIDFFRVILPWGLWFVAAMIGLIGNYRQLDLKIKALLWGGAGVALLSFVIRSDSWGNPMIVSSFASLLTAGAFNTEYGDAHLNQIAGRIIYIAVLLAGALALAFAVLIPVWDVFFHISLPWGILLTVPLAGIAAQTILLYNDKAAALCALPEKFGSSVLAATVLLTVIFSFLYPALDNFRMGKNFLIQAKEIMRAEKVTKLVSLDQAVSAEELFYIAPELPVVKINSADENFILPDEAAMLWEDTPESRESLKKMNDKGFILSAVCEEEFSELNSQDSKRRMFGIIRSKTSINNKEQ